MLVAMQHQCLGADCEHPVSPNVQHRCCALGDTGFLCVYDKMHQGSSSEFLACDCGVVNVWNSLPDTVCFSQSLKDTDLLAAELQTISDPYSQAYVSVAV